MGTIANRPLIMAQLWHNYETIIDRMNTHFDKIKVKLNYHYIII